MRLGIAAIPWPHRVVNKVNDQEKAMHIEEKIAMRILAPARRGLDLRTDEAHGSEAEGARRVEPSGQREKKGAQGGPTGVRRVHTRPAGGPDTHRGSPCGKGGKRGGPARASDGPSR